MRRRQLNKLARNLSPPGGKGVSALGALVSGGIGSEDSPGGQVNRSGCDRRDKLRTREVQEREKGAAAGGGNESSQASSSSPCSQPVSLCSSLGEKKKLSPSSSSLFPSSALQRDVGGATCHCCANADLFRSRYESSRNLPPFLPLPFSSSSRRQPSSSFLHHSTNTSSAPAADSSSCSSSSSSPLFSSSSSALKNGRRTTEEEEEFLAEGKGREGEQGRRERERQDEREDEKEEEGLSAPSLGEVRRDSHRGGSATTQGCCVCCISSSSTREFLNLLPPDARPQNLLESPFPLPKQAEPWRPSHVVNLQHERLLNRNYQNPSYRTIRRRTLDRPSLITASGGGLRAGMGGEEQPLQQLQCKKIDDDVVRLDQVSLSFFPVSSFFPSFFSLRLSLFSLFLSRLFLFSCLLLISSLSLSFFPLSFLLSSFLLSVPRISSFLFSLPCHSLSPEWIVSLKCL